MKSTFRYDLGKLNTFVKSISGTFYVSVGIMGDKNARQEAGMTNARLGAIHELGYPPKGIPPRSFLRMPMAHKSGQILKQASVGMLELLKQGKLITVLARLGIAAENAIQEAFESRGFGMWKPDKMATARRKGSDAPLIDTGQLRRSITSKVEARQ